MERDRESAVVSGIGLLTPIGNSTGETISALLAERCGLVFDVEGSGVFPLSRGTVPPFDPRSYIADRKAIKVMSRQTVLSCCAAALALGDAGLTREQLGERQEAHAVILGGGTAQGSMVYAADGLRGCVRADGTIDYQELGRTGYRQLPPLWILTRLPNTAAGQVSIQHQLKGLNLTIVDGPSNGIVAIGEALLAIRHGRCQRAVCGAAEEAIQPDVYYRLEERGVVSPTGRGGMVFAEESDGFICSEGAAVVLLEAESCVQSRNARGYARAEGYCSRYLPGLASASPPEIARIYRACMEGALADARIRPEQVSFVQASACGLRQTDQAEALAIAELFGAGVPVTASSSYVGQTFSASGAISVAHAALQLDEGIIAPIARAGVLCCEGAVGYVRREPIRPSGAQVALVNAFDYYGGAVSIVLRRPEVRG